MKLWYHNKLSISKNMEIYLGHKLWMTSYANHSDQKTRATLSTNQEQKLNQSPLGPSRFPALQVVWLVLLWVLIFKALPSILFAVVVSFYDILLKSVIFCNSSRFTDLSQLIEIKCIKMFAREDCWLLPWFSVCKTPNTKRWLRIFPAVVYLCLY